MRTVTTPRKVSVWWDDEGDFLEVTFDNGQGTMEPTDNPRVKAKIDSEGSIVGFHILRAGKAAKVAPFEVDLTTRRAPRVAKGA